MRPTSLCTALWIALGAPTFASAATPADTSMEASAGVHDFATVTAAATLTERAIEDVPSTVDVIDREQMDKQLVRDLKDLVRYEPGISVGSGTGRFGINDIRIRGLGGNRVRIETDGIAVSDSFAIGSFSNANRNFVDLDTLKRVEIVRGPASSLYGSDALGGVVAFVTKDPDDYLGPDDHAYFGAKLGYESDWQGVFAGVTTAFGGERWSGLVGLSHRQGQESGGHGDDAVVGALRTAPNPQSIEGGSLLTKLVFAANADQRFKLTVEGNEDKVDTEVLNLLGYQPRTRATTLSLFGDDQQTRARVSLAHEVDALDTAFADSLSWQVYRQDSETTQRTYEEQINAAGAAIRREREFNFDQRVIGVELMLHKHFATGKLDHTLTYGLDYSKTSLRQKRDGRAINHATGQATNVVPPDVYPVRDFPLTDTTSSALFAQDEISFAGGKFRLLPGLRIDHFELHPELDPIFAGDNPGMTPSSIIETNVSPKLGAVWKFAGDWSLFGSYARGFRSPPYNDVNLGFTNLQHGYAAIPNPDLRPETSDGFELGLRYAGPAAYAGLTGFFNRYNDFIESGVVVSRPPQSPLLIYQSQNVAESEIRGVELKAGLQLGELADALQGWSLRAAAAWQQGEDTIANRPLASVDPARATLGLSYESKHWGAELTGRFTQRKHRLANPTQFTPPGHGLLDLLAHWDFAPDATLNLGVFNLADRRYWDWADVNGLAANSPVLDRYLRPGRNVAVSITMNW